MSAVRLGLLAVSVLALGGCRNTFVYYPTRAGESELVDAAAELGLVPWTDGDGGRIGWRRPDREAAAHRIVLFHGNAGHSLHREAILTGLESVIDPASSARHFTSRVWDVHLFEYPGFGSRPGRPSEETIVPAAVAAVDVLLAEDPDRPVYLAGESLGTGVASQVAAARPQGVPGIMLITPFTNVVDVGAATFPRFLVRGVLTDRYDSESALERYDGRVGVLVAGRDEVVPAELGLRLYEGYAGPGRLWVQEEAGHNTLDYSTGSPWLQEMTGFLVGR